MKLVINGNEEEIQSDLTIQELLIHKKVKMPDTVAVAVNGVMLNRTDFANTRVKEKDIVEFIYFLGGGSER